MKLSLNEKTNFQLVKMEIAAVENTSQIIISSIASRGHESLKPTKFCDLTIKHDQGTTN